MSLPGGPAAASIFWNQMAGFSGINDLKEIAHQPVHLLALALVAIFDLIIFYTHTIKFSQISTEKWREWIEAENGLRARSCGHLSSSASWGDCSPTSATHSDCLMAIYSSLELPFATKLINFTLLKKLERPKIQFKTLNSPWRGRAMGSRS